MDWFAIAGAIIGVLIGAIGYFLARTLSGIDKLENSFKSLDTDLNNKFDDFKDDVNEKFVRRDTYFSDIGYIKAVLDKIFDKLDHKVDKA